MFGRIAAGLVHDLSHPIQNIGNSCKLIQKMFDDVEYRETFTRTVDREMVIVKRVLDDLRNIARPIPLERFPWTSTARSPDASKRCSGTPRPRASRSRAELSTEPVLHRGGRLRARPRLPQPDSQRHPGHRAGGRVVVTTERAADRVQVRVTTPAAASRRSVSARSSRTS